MHLGLLQLGFLQIISPVQSVPARPIAIISFPQAFLYALKDVVWVGILIILMLYIFAILACGFFGKSQPLTDAGFDTEGHFGSVFRSMVTLFQMITMDSWMSGITR